MPEDIAQDYAEAAACLHVSEKASATLSRRCLQRALVEAGNARKKTLAEQIDEIIPTLPGYAAEDLHALREIGNLAAHPTVDTVGVIVDVEPEEAAWSLDVLD